MSDSDNDDSVTHWGELPKHPKVCLVETDLTEDINLSMQPDCLDKYADDDHLMQIQDITLNPADPMVLYAIQLHKWMHNMIDNIESLELAPQDKDKIEPKYEKMPIPEMPDIKPKVPRPVFSSPSNEPVQWTEVDVPELSELLVKKLLAKSVAMMMAHIGFEDSYESILDILTDVLEEFFVKFCNRFSIAIKENKEFGPTGFPNAAERVLVELGLGGAKGLNNFYQCRIINYVSVLQKRCKKLEESYSSMNISKPISPTHTMFGNCFDVKVKTETDVAEEQEMGTGEGSLITNNDQLLHNLDSSMDLGDGSMYLN